MGGLISLLITGFQRVPSGVGRCVQPFTMTHSFPGIFSIALYKLKQKHGRVVLCGSNRRERRKGGGWERKPIQNKYFIVGCKH